jgi:transcriptional regulator with XRE-family HTH domain
MIERGWNKAELSRQSGISPAFICEIVDGTGNPSIKTLEAIAKALNVEAPRLLEHHVDDTWIGDAIKLPPGYERVSAILPTFDAYLVKKKAMETQMKLNKLKSKTSKRKTPSKKS